MCKKSCDLIPRDSSRGERWERFLTEESHLAGFQAWGGTPADDVAQEERLVDMEQHGGMRMFVAIIQSDQFRDLRHKASLLLDFTHHRLCWRLPHIGPSTWECPETIRFLPDEQQPVFVEDSATDVHFRRRIPPFAAEELADERRVDLWGGGQDLCRDALDVFVAFAVEGVLAKHQTILCDGLKTPDPL